MIPDIERALEYIAMPHFHRHAYATFFNAMNAGYASRPQKGTIKELPGSKTIEYNSDKWRVLDTYLVTPQSNYSGGMICIWYDSIPVWMMQFMGHYDKLAIPCLRAALKANFEARMYYGGRGPQFFRYEDGTCYFNCVGRSNFFEPTTGEEMIFGSDGSLLGAHRYQTVWMVKER